jgi:hypothetical protein
MPFFGEGEKVLIRGTAHAEAGLRKLEDPQVVAAQTDKLHIKIVRYKNDIGLL